MKLSLVTLVVFGALAFFPFLELKADGATGLGAKHLFHRLERLQPGANSYFHVKKLIIRLTQINPRYGAKYYKIGISRIYPAEASIKFGVFTQTVYRIVMKSDLSDGLKAKIATELNRANMGPY